MIEVPYSIDFEKIVLPHWSIVGHISEIPNIGDSLVTTIGKESIIIIRDNDNNINALLNVCPHRGSRICDLGISNNTKLVCPYHAWAFELTGEGVRGSLRKFHVKILGGLILIALVDTPLLLNNVLHDLLPVIKAYGWEKAKVVYRKTFKFQANWKVVLRDFLECYHCANVHPEYAKIHGSDSQRFLRKDFDPTSVNPTTPDHEGVYIPSTDHWVHKNRPVSDQESITVYQNRLLSTDCVTGSKDGRPVAPLMGKYKDKVYDQTRTGVIFGILNVTMSYPDYTVIWRLNPKSDNYSETEILWLVDESAAEGKDYILDDLIYLWVKTAQEDVDFLVKVQEGSMSYFFDLPGKLISDLEETVVRFNSWYDTIIGEKFNDRINRISKD
jgi:Rieske 2Fe-2S family protein